MTPCTPLAKHKCSIYPDRVHWCFRRSRSCIFEDCSTHMDSPREDSCSCCCGCCCRPCLTGAAFASFASLSAVWRWQLKLCMSPELGCVLTCVRLGQGRAVLPCLSCLTDRKNISIVPHLCAGVPGSDQLGMPRAYWGKGQPLREGSFLSCTSDVFPKALPVSS